MTVAALGDIADFINGFAFKPDDWHNEGLPIIRIQNLTDAAKPINYTTRPVPEKFRVRRGDLLVSWSATLGVFTWDRTDEALVNQHIFRVVPSEKVDHGFLRHMLSGALREMQMHLHGATMQHVNRGEFLATRIPLPSLPEQCRIAAILDHTDALRAKRRQVLDHVDALTQSIFNEMFADIPATSTVEARASVIRTGPFGSQLLHSEFVDQGIAVLGLDNVVGNEFRWGERRFITPAKYEKLKRYTAIPGDVLISIMGTTGRCVVVPDDIPKAINTKHICAITPDAAHLDPAFLRAAFLWHPESRAHLRRQTKGSIMDGLNMGIIKAMPIPVPPVSRQRAFAERARQVAAGRDTVTSAGTADDELFASLQTRAFRGEL